MGDAFYQGTVYKHPAYIPIENKTYTAEFKIYWLNGFSPLIGKDGILPVPDIYSDHAIGRAHVEPQIKTNHSQSSTDIAWVMWESGELDIPPTSNSFLIYCVDENRNACLLAYLDHDKENSHEMLNSPLFRRNIRDRANEFFKRQKANPMPKEDHDSLFGDKWVK